MQQAAVSYALTNKDRVKKILGITGTPNDVVVDALIAGVTDFVEGECGGRRFLRTTYTNELITIYNPNQKMLAVKNIPLVSVSALQYRQGLKSSPNYTDFATDDWEIVNDGDAGLIRVWGLSADINFVRISYVAGYLIDFDNTGTPAAHNLPFDLSNLAERLTVKLFKRREHEGVQTESYEGGTITWKDLLDKADEQVIARYRRPPAFV